MIYYWGSTLYKQPKKLKASADDRTNIAQMMISVFNFNPLPDDKILHWFKLKQIADDILKCI